MVADQNSEPPSFAVLATILHGPGRPSNPTETLRRYAISANEESGVSLGFDARRVVRVVQPKTTPIGKHPIPGTADTRYRRFMDAARNSLRYLAEWYLPELTTESVDDIVARVDAATTTMSDEGIPVRLVLTLAVPKDEVLYGVFAAPSDEIVSTTCERAGIPCQRLTSGVGARIGTGPEPEPASS
jgi:hypothetical protein